MPTLPQAAPAQPLWLVENSHNHLVRAASPRAALDAVADQLDPWAGALVYPLDPAREGVLDAQCRFGWSVSRRAWVGDGQLRGAGAARWDALLQKHNGEDRDR